MAMLPLLLGVEFASEYKESDLVYASSSLMPR
jgi:hypothetical protein